MDLTKKNIIISCDGLSLEYLIYNASSQSFKKKLLLSATGGLISEGELDKNVAVKALNNINFKIYENDRIGLVGHNGSGKTSLLRVLAGIYYPTGGSIYIKHKVTSLIDLNLGIDPEATGRENIKLRAAILGLKPKEIEEIVEPIIEFTGLGNFIDLPYRIYSAGMQLRLAFAVATTIKPKILVMDEWLSAGDAEFQKKANKRLDLVINQSDAFIFASHSSELVKNNCNRLIALDHGEIVFDGSPRDFYKDYKL